MTQTIPGYPFSEPNLRRKQVRLAKLRSELAAASARESRAAQAVSEATDAYVRARGSKACVAAVNTAEAAHVEAKTLADRLAGECDAARTELEKALDELDAASTPSPLDVVANTQMMSVGVNLPRPKMARVAGLLVKVSSWVLPAAQRCRYAEEFRAELWDVAEAGPGRWRQLACAARQLGLAWELRVELKAPHRRKAAG